MPSSLLRRAATAALALAFLLVAPAAAGAKDLGEQTPLNLPTRQPKALDASGGGGSGLVRTIVGLLIVVAVIYGLAWVLRQVKSSREERTRGTGLSTAAVVPLGPGRSLHLVRAGRELVLVGVAEHGVVPIRTYSEEEAARLGLDAAGDDPEPPRPARRPTTLTTLLDVLRERTVR